MRLRVMLHATALGLCAAISMGAWMPQRAFGQQEPGKPVTAEPESPMDVPSPTMFPHPDHTRYFLAGQANVIFQSHGPFHSAYEGPNSLLSRGEYKTSLIGTLYAGLQVNANPRFATDLIYNEESAGGRGLSEALGLAGFTNLDVVRNPSLGSVPYIARAELHQVIGLTSDLTPAERTIFSLPTQLPTRRLDFHLGKFSLPDFLDTNAVGTDSHLQFLNWTADNNGAWDYAADTRGYTYGLATEYADDPHNLSVRYALALMPTVANGINLQANLHRASGQNVEIELRHGLGSFVAPGLRTRTGAIRLLGFVNHANMGVYRTQNRLAAAAGVAPDITDHPLQTTVKYGVGLNTEQTLTPDLRVYARFGWNEGQHESYAYTEVDQTVSGGFDLYTRRFFPSRHFDKWGATYISNAIKRDHQAYLAAGGLGFLLGDGHLRYAREDILETYYNLHATRGVFYALDLQYVTHPGYNAARGPVLVESVRLHLDF